jgi:hypothetical protein
LTSDGSSHLALYIALSGLVLALIAIAAGAVRLVLQSRALKNRLDDLAKLPFLPTLELTSARLDIASRALDKVPELEARTLRAIEEFQAARARVVAAAGALRTTAQLLFWKVLEAPERPS